MVVNIMLTTRLTDSVLVIEVFATDVASIITVSCAGMLAGAV